jgi:hypothetical protein
MLKFVIVILLLFAMTYELSEGNILVFYSNIFFLIYFLLQFFGGKLKWPKQSIVLILFFVTLLISSLFSGEFIRQGLINLALQLSFFLIALGNSDRSSISLFLRSVLAYGAICAVGAFYIYISEANNLLGLDIYHKSGETARLYGWFVSGNRLGLFLGVCALISLHKLIEKNTTKYKLSYAVLFLLFLISLFYTGSRGSLLSAMLAALYYFFRSGAISFKNKMLYFPLMVFGSFISFKVFVERFSSLTINNFIDKFLTREYSATEDVRFDFWADALNAVDNMDMFNIYFGFGNGASLKYFEISLHNTYLTLFYDYGLFALITFLLLIQSSVTILHKFANKQEHGVLFASLFLFIIFRSITNTGILYSSFVGFLFMYILAISFSLKRAFH